MEKRTIFVVVLGVTALLLAYCLISKSWYSQKAGGGAYRLEVKAGMWSVRGCLGDQCETRSLSELADLSPGRDQGKHKAFAIFGKITFFLSLISVLWMIAIGAAAYQKPELAARLAKLGLLVVTVNILSGMVFVINKPTILNASWGVAAFMIAAVTGIVATAVLARPETYLAGGGRDPSIPRL